jgi:hypothetical protein
MEWILARLKEKSTWLGILGLATALGVSIAPEMKEAISSVAVSIVAVVLIATKEQGSVDTKPLE